MAAALTAWKSGEGSVAASRGTPVWVTPLGLAALAFSSASMGIQVSYPLDSWSMGWACADAGARTGYCREATRNRVRYVRGVDHGKFTPSSQSNFSKHLTYLPVQIWVELINDPKLFARTHVKSRDHKAGAIFCLFIGGLVARCIIDSLGSGATLGIGAGMRVLGAVWWIFSS